MHGGDNVDLKKFDTSWDDVSLRSLFEILKFQGSKNYIWKGRNF